MADFLNLYKIDLVNLASGGASLNDVLTWNGAQWVPQAGGGGGGSGTVTSVGLSMPGIFSVSGSPVTISGTLTAALVSQTANRVFASPDGVAGAPSFRALVAADIPIIPASGVSGLAAVATSGSASDLTTGSLALARIAQGGAALNDVLTWTGAAWEPVPASGGSGTVTSVALASPSLFTVSGSPVTATGTLTFAFATSQITAPTDGQLLLRNAAGTDFNRLNFGGTTSAFPSWQRNATQLRARLADDSANAVVEASQYTGLDPMSRVQLFGSGADGAVTFDGTTTVLGIAPASSVYTLTRDIFCTNITITGSSTRLRTAGYRVFCTGTLDISSAALTADTIQTWARTAGGSSTTNAGGAAGAIPVTSANVTLPAGRAGAAGGAGGGAAAGTAGTSVAAIAWALENVLAGAAGAIGGAGTNAAGGGGAGTTATRFRAFPFPAVVDFTVKATRLENVGNGGGSGGGGGGGNGTASTGGGGGGGGAASPALYIAARTIAFPSSAVAGLINNRGPNGGNGAPGQAANAGGGGGGGGGAGGYCHIVYENITGNATDAIDVTGGTGGNGGNGNGTGLGGAGGGGGHAGLVKAINVRTGVVTESVNNGRTAATAAPGVLTGATGVAATLTRFTLV